MTKTAERLLCLAMLLGASAWLWPIGVGGRMPVGGDVSSFSIGLMSVLDHALHEGRLPYWNDLWGYGFPGIGESQMGVYYPPHLLLYGLLSVELAYTASLVLHTLWAALGTAWAARRFGVSTSGAALAGFVGATCGFYQIHLTHPWGATVGSWMPWIWGLAWKLRTGNGGLPTAGLLASALAIQVLPGHFQLAFETQVGLLFLMGSSLFDRSGHKSRVIWVILAMAAAGLLASAQLVPTWRLAKLAESARTWEYLSGFASTPWHLVSYLTPGLFHRSPLWRPVAWDPFHTSPEEHLAYVGLAPLFLALGAAWRGARSDPSIRALTILAVVSTFLSFGPYLPGFSLLIQLPGFSFFRAPARWGLASMTALAILSGSGLDRLLSGHWPRPGRGLLRFVSLAIVPPVLLVLMFELALATTTGPGWPVVTSGFERLRSAMPWTGDPTFREVMAQARRPQTNPIVVSALLRQGIDPSARLDRTRFSTYQQELAPSAALMAALVLMALLLRTPTRLAAGLVILSAIDLVLMGHLRDLDTGPITPMTEQSPVLAALKAMPRGTRTIDPLGNLSMSAGADPVRAYRTLDLPTLPALTALAATPWPSHGPSDDVLAAMNAIGAQVRIFDPFSASALDLESIRNRGFSIHTFDDPALAGWLYGARWATSAPPRATRFVLAIRDAPTPPAFLIPTQTARILSTTNPMPPTDVLSVLRVRPHSGRARPLPSPHSGKARPLPSRAVGKARPLPSRAAGRARLLPSRAPLQGRNNGVRNHFRVEWPGQTESSSMPRTPPDTERPLLVVPVQHDPQWRAVWSNGRRTQPAETLRAFPQGAGGGWLASRVPGPGQWTLSWTYSPDSERLGQWISAPAWLVWTSFMVLFYLRPNLRRGRVSRQATWEGEAPAEPHE